MPEDYSFKFITTWTNSMTHTSMATATVTLTCGSAYDISEDVAPTTP